MNKLIRNKDTINSVSNTIDAVFLPAAALLVTPIFIHYLGIKDYGLWMLINSIIASLSTLNFGGANVIVKYISSYRNTGDKLKINQVFSTAFTFQCALSLVILTAAFLLPDIIIQLNIFDISINQANTFKYAIYIGTGIFIIKLLEQVITGLFKGYERYDIATIFSVSSKSLLLLTQVIAAIYGEGLLQIFTYSLIVLFLVFFAQLCALKFLYKEVSTFRYFNLSTLYEMLEFSWWSWLLSSTMIIVSHLDRWVIGALAGFEILGYYSIAYMIMNHIHMILSSSVAWTFPRVSKEGISAKTSKLFHSLHAFIVSSSTLISFILLNAKSLFIIWLGQDTYEEAGDLINLILIVTPIFSLSILPFYYANGSGHIKLNFYNSILTGIIRFILMLALFSIIQAAGIIYAIGISSLIMSLHYYWIIKHRIKMTSMNINFFLIPVTIYTFFITIITSQIITNNLIITAIYLIILISFIFTYKNHISFNLIKRR